MIIKQELPGKQFRLILQKEDFQYCIRETTLGGKSDTLQPGEKTILMFR